MKNWLLTSVTVLLLYVLLEIFCLDIFFRFLPHGAYPLLDEGVAFALQPTKHDVMPKNYMAILGDSYAMGLGDAYYDTSGRARAEYGSAPYLALGRDVISFGTAGNSSISAMVTQPHLVLKFFNRGWRTSLQPPEDILVYFYEGNDFSDNVEYPHYSRKRVKFQHERVGDSLYLQEYIEQAAVTTHPWNRRIEQMHWYDQLYLAKFCGRAFLALVTASWQHLQGAGQQTNGLDSPLNLRGRYGWNSPGSRNRVVLNGEVVQIPDKLQGPSSLGLTESEKKLSLLSYTAALRHLKKSFPRATIRVVYLPSVVASYEIASADVHIQNYRREQGAVYPAAEVYAQSDWGAQQIRQITEAEGLAFIDSRPSIRSLSKTRLVHGPKDWNHFNQSGYRALAEAILPAVQSSLQSPVVK